MAILKSSGVSLPVIMAAVLCAFSVSARTVSSEPPVMGWSSWNAYHVNISDSLIKRQADALVSLGLDKAGYRYVNIDDGYFGGRDADGRLMAHPERFPAGLKGVVDHIHGLGLKAGIYSDAGRNTCGFYYDADSIGRGVGLLGHEREDAGYFFRDLGFDFIKVDFCGGNGLGGEPVLDERERYTAIKKAIDAAGRRDVRMNVCRWNYPGTWVGEIASSWRISQDIRPRWSSVKDIIGQNMYLSAYAGEGRYNDMDMLEVGRGMSAEEDHTHFAMWCMMASPLLIGADLESLDGQTLALLSDRGLIALDQETCSGQAYVVSRQGEAYLLVRDVESANGCARAVAFYNGGDIPEDMTLWFDDIDLDGKVWAKGLAGATEGTGVHTDCMSVTVPPHGTLVYRLEAERRTERRKYEAECGFISDYQELENPLAVGTGYYLEDDLCSGGAKAVNLGGRPWNDLVWNDVYADGGRYAVAVTSVSESPRTVRVEVNGKSVGELSFNGAGVRSVDVTLKKGVTV